jgi:uncharacterized protein YdeI (YjbR/CyaY-like superfamily)
MAPFIVNPDHVFTFGDAASLEKWYRKNHASADELWIKLAKKGSGVASVTNVEALDVALCWGWIDAIRKSLDDSFFLQRYTPRKKTSIWSKVNIGHVDRLRKAGRMQPAGEEQVKLAQGDGRWARAYGDFKDDEFPADLMAAIEAEPKAKKLFATLTAQNRFAIAFRTHNMKTAAGRSRKIDDLVAMLARGETPHPNGKKK